MPQPDHQSFAVKNQEKLNTNEFTMNDPSDNKSVQAFGKEEIY
jgi:hypothetical protein